MDYIAENELTKQYNKMKCSICDGKGTVKLRQGINKCYRCDGTGIMTCNL